MTSNSIPQVRDQGGPIKLLARLHRTSSYLPGATFQLSPIYPDRLDINVHDGLGVFEVWRSALGLGAPVDRHYEGASWLVVDGLVDDVPVRLIGHGATADVRALAAALVAA